MRYFPTLDTLSLLEVWWTESYFWGCIVAHSFVQKVLLQLKKIGHSLFYTETETSFSNRVSNDNCLSEYIVRKQCSCSPFILSFTAWKASKYGVFSGPYSLVFELNTEFYSVNLCIQSEYRKIRTRKNSVFWYFSRSDC